MRPPSSFAQERLRLLQIAEAFHDLAWASTSARIYDDMSTVRHDPATPARKKEGAVGCFSANLRKTPEPGTPG